MGELFDFMAQAGAAGLSPILAAMLWLGFKAVAEVRGIRRELGDLAHHMDVRVSRLEWHHEIKQEQGNQ